MTQLKLHDDVREYLPQIHNIYGAIERSDEGAVRTIVAEGFDINTSMFYTPLTFASLIDSEPMIRLLCELKANPNAPSMFNFTAMHVAAKQGKAAIIRLLVDHGAQVDQCIILVKGEEEHCNAPLHIAAKQGDVKVVRTLLKLKANPNLSGSVHHQRPLHYAVQFKHLKTVKVLLEHGADPELTDIVGNSPISLAASNPAMLEILNEAKQNKLSVEAFNRTYIASPMLSTEEQAITLTTMLAANPKTKVLNLREITTVLTDAALEALSNAMKVNRNIKEIIFYPDFDFTKEQKPYLDTIRSYCSVNKLIADGLKSYPNPNSPLDEHILCHENFQLKMQLNNMERSLADICTTRLGFFTQEQAQPMPANPSAIAIKQGPMQA